MKGLELNTEFILPKSYSSRLDRERGSHFWEPSKFGLLIWAVQTIINIY